MEKKPRLQILPGYKGQPIRLGSILVTPATTHEPPFPVDASVLEEDTWRLLSAPIAVPQEEHPVRLMTDLVSDRPALPGEVLIQGARWLAIVHDVDQMPTCREIWVHSALQRALFMIFHHLSVELSSVIKHRLWRDSQCVNQDRENAVPLYDGSYQVLLLQAKEIKRCFPGSFVSLKDIQPYIVSYS